MNYIDINKQNIIKARKKHIKELKSKILGEVSNCQNQKVKDFLTEEKIELILESYPKKLYQINLLFF